jgi:hypothetical protein
MDIEAVRLLVCLVVGGGLLFVFSYLTDLDHERLRKSGGRARGVIVRHNFHVGRNSTSRSVVRFTTQEGVLIEAEYQKGIATAIPSFSVGALVSIAYDKENPYDFLIMN